MKTKLKTNCSIVRMFGMFECGRVVRSIIAVALCAVGFAAFADGTGTEEDPWQVGSPKAADVTAWTNGTGKLTIEGAGDMRVVGTWPWSGDISSEILSIDLGAGVTGIGEFAFSEFSSLGEVEIPAAVTNIAGAAFYECSSLSNVTMRATVPPALGGGAFNLCDAGLIIYVPHGQGNAYKNAPGWFSYKDKIFEMDPQPLVAQFIQDGEVIDEFASAKDAVEALDDEQYKDIEEFRIGFTAGTEFDFGGRTNRVVIGNVGAGTNTLKNVLLDCAGDYVVTGLVGTVVFGDGVRIEKETGFTQGLVNLIIKGGLYKSDPSKYCEGGYLGARRCDANAALNGLYDILPKAEIAVTVSKGVVPTHYATLQDAFNLAIGENEDVTLRLFNNLELGTAVTKLEGNKFIHLLPSESGANTIKRVGAEPVIEIGRGAKLEIKNVIFNGANVPSEKPMIEVAGKTGRDFGWLIADDGFVVSNAVGGAVHVGNGGKFELNGVAKIFENMTGGKPKNVIIEDSKAILLTASGAVTDGNYAQIGVSSDTDKFMIPGGQFGEVNLSYEYATYFSDGDISVAKPWVGFINDCDGTLHHAAGAKIAAAPKAGEGKKTYKRWVGGKYKVTLEEGDHLISREKSIVSERPELIWTARQDAPEADKPAAIIKRTGSTLKLVVKNGCDYAVLTPGMTATNWVSMVDTDGTYTFEGLPNSDTFTYLKRYSITPSNVVSAAVANPPIGCKWNPWKVGATDTDDVTAYVDADGTTVIAKGEGTPKTYAIGAAPWNGMDIMKVVVPYGRAEEFKAAWSEYYAMIEESDPPVSAVSAEGFLDLTAGDRIAADEETLVVDPAWGNAKTATVEIDGETDPRTYDCASNDLWQTATLTPGRYTLEFAAGTLVGDDAYTAAFWKTGDDWMVFDSSNITADVTFEAGKTYLFFGTNTVDSVTLTVMDGAKLLYDERAPAGFLGGTVAELPKRYAKVDAEGGLYQIVEKIKGCADNPWDVGVGVEAYTNGTELVIVGKGTIADLSEIPADVKRGIAAITVGDGVTDAAAGVFFGFDGITVTLQDNWKGELPDEKNTWCGAKNVELTRWPMAVKNVKPQQRYPWNGLVDIKFALTGEGSVKVAVQVTVDGKALADPTVDGETTFDLGGGSELKDLRLTWDAKADFGDAEKHEKIKVKLTVSPVESD